MFRLEFRAEATVDATWAATYLESQREGAGGRFVQELDQALARVAENPLAFQVIEADVRRILLRRFPYAAFYVINDIDRAVTVIAILHVHQDEGAWRGRRTTT